MTIHVCRNGQEIGQYTRQVFDRLIDQGRLFPADHFWVEGMPEWKPISVAKMYFGHHEKCRHCGGKMTDQKPAPSGPRKGEMHSICLKCGPAEFHLHS